MNREIEFRRLRWLLKVQEFINNYKYHLMVSRLDNINTDEPTLEFNVNELARTLDIEKKITELSYTYDFDEDPTDDDVIIYLVQIMGLLVGKYIK